MQIKACIGAGYGDEGKGMWVDHLVRTSERPLVVRSNSGGQVGHTVCREDKRYIFSHIGSGSLEGVPTLFTRETVVNPLLFNKEVAERNAGVPYEVFIDYDCPVTTPYDMLLNQATEVRRGSEKHGSVGVGFGVTLEREESGVRFRYFDISKTDKSCFRLGQLRRKIGAVKEWCLSHLGPPREADDDFINEVYRFFKTSEIEDLFIEDCDKFFKDTHPSTELNLSDYQTLIFENGQGLMLDQEYGYFPHVTRSNTGFRNVGKFLKRNKLFNAYQSECVAQVDVYYLSRCYTTRHGAGPLPYERPQLSGITVVDETNKLNTYQGSFRLAPLNLLAITKAIEWDQRSHPYRTSTHKVVTCCDQIQEDLSTVIEYVDCFGVPRFVETQQFQRLLSNHFNVIVNSPRGIV